MTADSSRISEQAVLHATALVVALCSFAYELVYSELLTVMYGGTVTQYGLTIGLFFSSLGIGSYLAQHFDDTEHSNFFRTEVYLAFAAPLGFLLILWLNTAELPGIIPNEILQAVARLPVVVIGILSGFELPLLMSMVETEYGNDAPSPEWVDRLGRAGDTAAYALVSLLFHTSRESEEYDTYSTVLTMDYLGGLGGALIYVFVLYPELGLMPSVFVLALLNCVAALLFTIRFSGRPWGLFKTENRVIRTQEAASLFIACLLLTGIYSGVALQHQTVSDELSKYYMEGLIEKEYSQDTVEVNITSQFTTKHQQVIQYERTWDGESDNQMFASQSETCMRLDSAIQLCESWAESYHHGLVDVPLSMYENSTDTDVLLVGGGDWIAANNLREHGVSVDQVDIDGEFMAHTKNNEFTHTYHNNAYKYENLTTHQQDIYTYLQQTDKEYDIILLDLPGAKSDDLLNLYSVEFYTMLNKQLSNNGVVVTWAYSEYAYGEHHKAYMNTVHEAGLEHRQSYWARDDFNEDGSEQLGERFFILAPDNNRPEITPKNGSAYVQDHSEQYESVNWQDTPQYTGVEVNSVFDPNYEIIVSGRVDSDKFSDSDAET